jgi:hypothetical protein
MSRRVSAGGDELETGGEPRLFSRYAVNGQKHSRAADGQLRLVEHIPPGMVKSVWRLLNQARNTTPGL